MKLQMLFRRPARLTFFPRSDISGSTSRRAFECPTLHEWWTQPAHVRCRVAQLQDSRNLAVFKDYVMNLVNNLQGGHFLESFRTRRNTGGKITTFKLGHPVFDGSIHWCIFTWCLCQNCVKFLRRFALQEKKNLMKARVPMLLKSRASPDMLPFYLCNKKRLVIRHMNGPLFPTTLSIPSYNMGK